MKETGRNNRGTEQPAECDGAKRHVRRAASLLGLLLPVFALILVLSHSVAVRADTIILIDGRTLDGTVVKETGDSLAIKTKSGLEIIKRSDIRKLTRDTPAAGDQENAKAKASAPAKPAPSAASYIPAEDKTMPCPRCKGKGIIATLTCNACANSLKPGYRLSGATKQYFLCDRCQGTTFVDQQKCAMCGGKGNVFENQVLPEHGGTKQPPAGRIWCTVCKGTKYETWTTCSQCKRSKWPGYVYSGETISVCNRCNATAKIPGTLCSKCNGQGVLDIDQGAGSEKEFVQPKTATAPNK